MYKQKSLSRFTGYVQLDWCRVLTFGLLFHIEPDYAHGSINLGVLRLGSSVVLRRFQED